LCIVKNGSRNGYRTHLDPLFELLYTVMHQTYVKCSTESLGLEQDFYGSDPDSDPGSEYGSASDKMIRIRLGSVSTPLLMSIPEVVPPPLGHVVLQIFHNAMQGKQQRWRIRVPAQIKKDSFLAFSHYDGVDLKACNAY
jgi:hypothetical protein